MMNILKGFLFSTLLVVSVVAQEFHFQREPDTIPVIINGVPAQGSFIGGFASSIPTLADVDNDGDFDLLVGQRNGNIIHYSNLGTGTNPNFKLETENLVPVGGGGASAPTFTDIDNDGDSDLFVGDISGSIRFYQNTGTAINHL